MTMKPTYEELKSRVQELEKIESEYKSSKEALRKSEALFRLLYEKAPLGYQSLDENGHFIVVNQTWLEALGYAKEEVIGKPFADFLHPDWQDHFKENFPRFKSIGEVLGVEFEMVKKNGDHILVSFTGKISRDGKGNFQQTHCIFHDITGRRLAEEALRESENQISSIFRSAPVGIGSVVNRVLIKVNNRLCEMTGYDETDLIGHSSRMLYPSDEDFDFVGRVKYAHIADHGTGMVETRWQKQDGTIMDVLLSSTPVDLQDQSKGVTFTALDNLFEPFFTTKAVGKGTGLGLATVYGIVKQNNGFINVYSDPGQGSTFKIYLPRLVADEDTDKAVPEKKATPGGTETILLVEDEPSILRMTRMMLEKKGYKVLYAATPSEALEKTKNHSGSIDLLMTDVVMPEMNGRDLSGQITDLYPDIRLLFMSGYTANVIAHQGILDDGVAFIQKPFSMAELAEKLREVLDTVSDKAQG